MCPSCEGRAMSEQPVRGGRGQRPLQGQPKANETIAANTLCYLTIHWKISSRGPPELGELHRYGNVVRLHALGPHIVYEMLVEIGAPRTIRSDIEATLTRYVTRFCWDETGR